MKVLHILGGLRPSGMERMLQSSASHFARLGCDQVIAGFGDRHPFADDLREVGLDVRENKSFKSAAGMLDLVSLLRDVHPEIVHIHLESAFAVSVLATRMFSSASVVRTVHNVFPTRGRRSLSRRAQARMVDKFVHAIVGPSPDVCRNEQQIGRQPRCIYNWVDDRFFERRHVGPAEVFTDAPIALVVGNPSSPKNHEFATALIRSAAEWALAYFGSEEHASQELVQDLDQLQAEGRLMHRGVGDPYEAYVTSTVFLMPSLHEGMPVSLAEALVSRLPALVSDQPGLRWANGLTGVKALPLDPQSWGDELIELGNRQAATPASEYSGPDFTAQRGASEYFELYSTLRSGTSE